MGSSQSQPTFKPIQPVRGQKPALAPLAVPEGVRISDDLVGRVKLSPSGKPNAAGEDPAKPALSTSGSQVATPTSQIPISPKVNIATELLPRLKTATTPKSASSPLVSGYTSEPLSQADTSPEPVAEQAGRVTGTSPLSPRSPVNAEAPIAVQAVDPTYVDSLRLPPDVRGRIESYPC